MVFCDGRLIFNLTAVYGMISCLGKEENQYKETRMADDINETNDLRVEEKIRPDQVVAWTLDFIYQDLKKIGEVERVTLALEINQYLMKRFNIVASLGEETIAFITKTLDIGKIQKALQDHFHTFFLPLIKGDLEKAPDWVRPMIKYIEVSTVVDGILDMGLIQGAMIQDEQYWDITAIQNFRDALSVLQPLPINTFQKCEGCERYFFPGKGARRTRRFCTRACNLRHSAKLRRKREATLLEVKQLFEASTKPAAIENLLLDRGWSKNEAVKFMADAKKQISQGA